MNDLQQRPTGWPPFVIGAITVGAVGIAGELVVLFVEMPLTWVLPLLVVWPCVLAIGCGACLLYAAWGPLHRAAAGEVRMAALASGIVYLLATFAVSAVNGDALLLHSIQWNATTGP